MRWLAALWLVAVPARALAVVVSDQDLRVDVGTACVAWPRQLQDREACAGVDLERMEAAAAAQTPTQGMKLVALVVWPASATLLSVQAGGFMSPTEDGISDMLAGMHNAMGKEQVVRRGDPRLAHERTSVSGTTAVLYAPAHLETRPVAYFVFGRQRMVNFLFAAPQRPDGLRPFAADIMSRVRLDPMSAMQLRDAESARGRGKGLIDTESPSYKQGKIIGQIVGAVLGVLILGGLIRKLLS